MIPSNQSNTDIFAWILLQPNKLSIDHRTNSVFEDDGLVDGILSCRIELLHLVLDVISDCVEEDDDFLREIVRLEIWLDGSMSIHTLSLSGMVVVPVDSLG